MAFSTDSQLVAVVAGSPGRIQVWDVRSRSPIAEIDSRAISLALDDGGRWLIAGRSDSSLAVCDVETERIAETHPVYGSWLQGLALSPEHDILASAGGDQVIHLWRWQVRGGTVLQRWIRSELLKVTEVKSGLWILHAMDARLFRQVRMERQKPGVRTLGIRTRSHGTLDQICKCLDSRRIVQGCTPSQEDLNPSHQSNVKFVPGNSMTLSSL